MEASNTTNISLNQTGCATTDTVAETIIKTVAQCALLLASLVGNALVILVIYRVKSMRTTVNYFLMNMAVSDLIIPAVVLPRDILETSSGSVAWRLNGGLGVATCKFVYFLSDITPSVSVLSLVFMTCDRFCAVAFPFKASLIPSAVRRSLIAITWLVSMAFFAPYFYSFELVPGENGDVFCRLTWGDRIHIIFITVICLTFIVIPFALLASIYTAILVILYRNRGTGEEMERERKRREKVNKTVMKLALAIVLLFALCWGPYNGVIFTIAFVWQNKIPRTCSFSTIWFIARYLAYSTSALNPLVLFALNENYRNGLKRVLGIRRSAEIVVSMETNTRFLRARQFTKTTKEQGKRYLDTKKN
ncbi:neuropeptide SIFamide receptor [Nematostella vectensis]|uniref:neuropeptide SIFamide receptor n=1 Tax=Nematostella vectensis TaxID=45351 RepID=UPI001390614C|nr:neuropeptide SIFamide receptor [Nematostella vectensis]